MNIVAIAVRNWIGVMNVHEWLIHFFAGFRVLETVLLVVGGIIIDTDMRCADQEV